MSNYLSPVVLIVFNRPDLTQKLIHSISSVKPGVVFVIADGPRANVPSDINACARTRETIKNITWECHLYTNYADENLGCRRRVETGLDWVFSQVESAIILEDDCIPEPSFFYFCTELLSRYETDQRIMAISGNNFQFGRRRTADSYYFSRYPHCWGWATWKRAWQYYDADMACWPSISHNQWLVDILGDRSAKRYWQHKFQKTYEGTINSWAFVWTLSCWLQSGLCILPNVNLVSNIGFDGSGTHHVHSFPPFARMATSPIEFPLKHPAVVIRDARADAFTQRHQFGLWARGRRKISTWLRC